MLDQCKLLRYLGCASLILVTESSDLTYGAALFELPNDYDWAPLVQILTYIWHSKAKVDCGGHSSSANGCCLIPRGFSDPD